MSTNHRPLMSAAEFLFNPVTIDDGNVVVKWNHLKTSGNFHNNNEFANFLLDQEMQRQYQIVTDPFQPPREVCKVEAMVTIKGESDEKDECDNKDECSDKNESASESDLPIRREYPPILPGISTITGEESLDYMNLNVNTELNPIDNNNPEFPKVIPTDVTDDIQSLESPPPPKKEFKCEKCDRYFGNKRFYEQHLLSHPGIPNMSNYRCTLCGKEFKTKGVFYKHCLTKHNANDNSPKKAPRSRKKMLMFDSDDGGPDTVIKKPRQGYECNVCGQSFTRRLHCEEHQYTHTGVRQFNCKVCSREFTLKKSLIRHHKKNPDHITEEEREEHQARIRVPSKEDDLAEVTVSPDGKRTYKCKFCSDSFTKRAEFNKHLCRPNGEAEFPCNICNKTFPGQTNLVKHMVLHSDTLYPCKVCGKTFRSNMTLKAHKRLHSGELFPCSVCGNGFATVASLKIHERKHSGSAFTCDQCGRHFTEKRSLELHYSNHVNLLQFKCDKCPKVYNNSQQLHVHNLRIHLKLNRYGCKQCGDKFKHSTQLRRHQATHAGFEPYRCEYCGKEFVLKQSYTLHLRTHTGERPFACEHCGGKFMSKAHLRRHKKLHDNGYRHQSSQQSREELYESAVRKFWYGDSNV